MAQMSIKLSAKVRWWVKPFIYCAWVVALPLSNVIHLDAYAERVGRFVTAHGVSVSIQRAT